MKRAWGLLLSITALLVFSTVANAALLKIGTANYSGIDFNLIYEDDQGLVWLDYTNITYIWGGTTHGTNGDTWQNQVAWATGLGENIVITLDPGYTTSIDWSTGWRLPIVDESKANLSGGYGWEGPDQNGYHDYKYGYNMVNSEMGYLFYALLGNKGFRDTSGTVPLDWGLLNKGPFENLAPDWYWSSTGGASSAWFFSFWNGIQSRYSPTFELYGMAVRPGEVTAAPVPEPSTMLLIGTGLVGLVGFRRKFKA